MQPAAIALQLALFTGLWLGDQRRFVLASAKQRGRIDRGDKVSLADYPFVVNIWSGNAYIASGTIISQNCILTAGHALAETQLDDIRVYGAVSEPTCSQAFEGRAEQIITPHFDSPTPPPIYLRRLGRPRRQAQQLENGTAATSPELPSNCCAPQLDIAVIVLKEPQCSKVAPIPIDETPVWAGDEVTVAGWGHSDIFDEPSIQLTAFNSTVTPDFRCQFFWGADRIADTHFCVEERRLGSRPNSKDAGGPAIRRGKQVGVISTVNECTNVPVPSAYTRLSSAPARAFLRETLEAHC